ncbi:hypothetical protein TRM7557_01645 [Tritonibacter multivorans]|uniref:Uncharacterized protein n=1 Tax=Tritonibacter multivorans TaxID=928856 RepID=A0A0P1G8R5_9RHOB|nr:hypothetical protein TRM7557_01645 [Tritonibacter multivorans]
MADFLAKVCKYLFLRNKKLGILAIFAFGFKKAPS